MLPNQSDAEETIPHGIVQNLIRFYEESSIVDRPASREHHLQMDNQPVHREWERSSRQFLESLGYRLSMTSDRSEDSSERTLRYSADALSESSESSKTEDGEEPDALELDSPINLLIDFLERLVAIMRELWPNEDSVGRSPNRSELGSRTSSWTTIFELDTSVYEDESDDSADPELADWSQSDVDEYVLFTKKMISFEDYHNEKSELVDLNEFDATVAKEFLAQRRVHHEQNGHIHRVHYSVLIKCINPLIWHFYKTVHSSRNDESLLEASEKAWFDQVNEIAQMPDSWMSMTSGNALIRL